METDPAEAANFRMMVDIEDRQIALPVFQSPLLDVLAWDAKSGVIVAANSRVQKSTGRSLRQLIKMKVYDLLPKDGATRLYRLLVAVRRRLSRQAVFRAEYRDAAGTWRSSRIHLHYLSGTRPTFVATIQNMSGFDAARTAATRAESILATALEALPDGFVLYDDQDRLVICNDRYREIYPESAPAMVKGASFKEILEYGLEQGQYVDAIGREADWLHARLSAHRRLNSTVEQRLSSGKWLRIVERSTRYGGRVGLRMDITELKRNQRMLEQAAFCDALTGLMNRRGLMDTLDVLQASLAPNERIAILHFDLDKFKSVNDAQGHAAGDFVLQHCADILREHVSDDSMVARAGGDEFIALMTLGPTDDDALRLAQDLVFAMSKPIRSEDRICSFGASVGLAYFDPAAGGSIETALTNADIALNAAKQDGRGLCRIFESKMREATLHHILMTQQIKAGITAHQFEPHYQPQINAMTGEIIGFEALIRWHHPDRGLVPAFEFLLAAERAGLMDQLDAVVLDRACFAVTQMMSWGLLQPRVSVNMSMAQILDPDITDKILQNVGAYGISPDNLRVELLESTLIEDESTVIIDNVHRLIQAGFAIELDDFGTGHSAIATLRKFAVSRIKIDRSLVQNISKDTELQVITGAIVELANRLGVRVLAEGVETQAEQEMINHLDCQYAQGYLHGRPMSLDDLKNWINQHRTSLKTAAYPQSSVLG